MRITLLFYADFGSKKGKGMEIYYIAKELKERGYLYKAIVRDVEKNKYTSIFSEMNLLQRAMPLGNFFPRVLVGVEKFIFPKFPSRYYGEILFDKFAAEKIPADGQIFYALPRMVSSMTKAKESGYVNVLQSTEAHPSLNQKLIKEEYEKFGVKIYNPAWNPEVSECYLKSIQLADYIIVLSEFARQNHVENGSPEEKIFVNPLGVDLDRFKPADGLEKELIYLFVGNISIIKGVQYLLKAWKELNLKNARLIICGEIRKESEEIIKIFQPLPNVEFTGQTNPLPYYQKSSVFVFPSLSEGIARVRLEAMACGLPVITTLNAGSVVRDGIDGFLVPARDAEVLKDKILYFYNNPDAIKTMGKNARRQAEKYTWEANIKRLVEIFDNIGKR